MLKVGLGAKRPLAVSAHKVFWMPLPATGIDAISFDGLIATSTAVGKDAIETALTEGVPLFLIKGVGPEGSQTLCAYEAVYVPLLAHCIDAAALDGPITVGTSGKE